MELARTAVFRGVKDLSMETYPKPKASPGKVVMKVTACAICTWEQRVYSGVKEVVFPFIGGHEISGEIVAVGTGVNPEYWQMGDKVVYGAGMVCGDCYFCKIGQEQNCQHFDHSKQLGGLPHKGMGGFSEYMVCDPRFLFHYERVTPEEAALTEPLSCVIHSCETANIQYGDTVVIIGCGIMGLLHTQLAIKSGARVICSDMNDQRLALAKSLGAHHIVNPQKADLKTSVMELTQGVGAQVVFDTTPVHQVAAEAVTLLAQLGCLVLYSSFYPDEPIGVSPDRLHKRGTRIVGTANSNSRDFVRATQLISQGIIDVSPFISQIYSFDDIHLAMEKAISGENYRVVVNMQERKA